MEPFKTIGMKRTFLFLSLLWAFTAFAQESLHQILILNEGYTDYLTGEIIEPVSVGSIDPDTYTYTELFTVDGARFASDLVIDGDRFFVAADDQLLSYDLNTYELLASAEVAGIRKIAIWNDQVIVTRGEYLVTLDSHVEVFGREDLNFLYAISTDDIPYTTEGIAVIDDKAYVAVNNGFDFGNEVGQIAVIDLNSEMLETTVELGADGINPDNLMVEDGIIYTLNNKDFTGSSVSTYSPASGTVATVNLMNISSGCGTSTLREGLVYYQEMFGTSISRFDPASELIVDENEFGYSFYALSFEPVSGTMMATTTDFFSTGSFLVFDDFGAVAHEVAVGVSPGTIAFDVRNASAIQEKEIGTLRLYPNPASGSIVVSGNGMLRIYNTTGQLVDEQTIVSGQADVSALIAGLYTLQLEQDGVIYTTTLVKE